jgi:tetratricopeptide (TPR) repeat protein
MKARAFTRPLALLLLLFAAAFSSFAGSGNATIDSANAAYARTDFEKAAKLYEEVLSSGSEAAEVYYNLGNAYFKLNQVGPAILNYEKARKLAPGDEDIEHNLELASQRAVDKIEAVPQLFIEEWKTGLRSAFTEKGWSWLTITGFCLVLLATAFVIAGRTVRQRQYAFLTGLLFLICTVISFVLARQQYDAIAHESDAIVMTATVTVKGSPADNGTKLFVIHEGAKVHIEDTEGSWVEIKLANGNVGWIPASALAFI